MEKIEHHKKRVDFDMSQFGVDDRESMIKMYEETLKSFVVGSIVPGTILEVRSNEVLVDIGYKSEGVISGMEFPNLKEVNTGDKLDVLLEQIEDEDGMVVLSKQKAEQKIRWENMVSACAEGSSSPGGFLRSTYDPDASSIR